MMTEFKILAEQYHFLHITVTKVLMKRPRQNASFPLHCYTKLANQIVRDRCASQLLQPFENESYIDTANSTRHSDTPITDTVSVSLSLTRHTHTHTFACRWTYWSICIRILILHAYRGLVHANTVSLSRSHPTPQHLRVWNSCAK